MGELELFNTPIEETRYFASIDSRGNIRCVNLKYKKIPPDNYQILRTTFQYKCRRIVQPPIIIKGAKKGNYKATELKFKSLAKEYLDKGYKELDKCGDDYDLATLKGIVGDYKTDKTGLLKPMLCKMAKSVTNKKIFDKEYYASRKLDGVRSCIYYDSKRKCLRARSRTAIDLDFPLKHILEIPKFIKLFEKNPDLVLDGEVYKHGMPLNRISGLCRSQQTAYDSDVLEFYMYDIVDVNLTFQERLEKMYKIRDELYLSFDPYRQWDSYDLKVQFVPQVKISGWDNIVKLHNKYVEEGFEGLVIRLASAKYGPGKRNNNMIKVKMYNENTFKCIGIEQGLRMYDDMVFIMETREGKTFKAKPLGDHEQKVEYTNNFQFYKNKLGDCKYFNISEYGIPTQPSFIAFRFDLTEADLHD